MSRNKLRIDWGMQSRCSIKVLGQTISVLVVHMFVKKKQWHYLYKKSKCASPISIQEFCPSSNCINKMNNTKKLIMQKILVLWCQYSSYQNTVMPTQRFPKASIRKKNEDKTNYDIANSESFLLESPTKLQPSLTTSN